MGDTELNEGAVGESIPLVERPETTALDMRNLLSRTDIDTGAELNTALHRAVLSVCGNDNNGDVSYRQLDMLMSQSIELNMPNKEGYTAIGLAVEKRHKKCVKHMLKHELKYFLRLDYYPGDRESTVREIIMQTYPDLQRLLPAPLLKRLDSSDNNIKLLAALQCDTFQAFRERLNETNANLWYDEPYHSYLLEIACQMKKRKKFIKLLLDCGADPNIKNRVTGMPLIHTTARCGNCEVLQLLLKKEEINVSLKDYKDRTNLHWLAQVRERKPDDKDILENCFKVLLDKHSVMKLDIDLRDVSGKTALYIALENGFRDSAKLLLIEGANVNVLEKGSEVLLSESLSILEEFLDACLQSNDERLTNRGLLLILKNELLKNIVPRIAEFQHLRYLLKQPVISTYLYLKWLKFRSFVFSITAWYMAFLFVLTFYILYSEPYSTVNEAGAASNTTGPFSSNDSNITPGINDSNFTSEPNSSSLRFMHGFLMFFLFFLISREMQQLAFYRWAYIKSLKFWLEILLIISTFISCSGVVDGSELKVHFSAVALLLGWSEMLMISGRLPLYSEHLTMLRTVIWTVLRLMAGYITLLIAFALSFYILFKGNTKSGITDMFANPLISLLKTFVMLTGEFEVSYLPFDTFPYTSNVIFVLFVFLVTIVLLNLLVAVSQTDAIQDETETLCHLAKIRLISEHEAIMRDQPPFMKRFSENFVDLKFENFILHPKRGNFIDSNYLKSVLSKISKKTKSNNKRKSTGIQVESSTFTEKLSALQIRQEEMETKMYSKFEETQKMLKQILDRLNIPESETTRP